MTTFMAMLLLVPSAMAQDEEETQEETVVQEETTVVQEETLMQEDAMQEEEPVMVESTEPLPASGGLPVGSVFLPAAALLLGSGVLTYAVLRRSR